MSPEEEQEIANGRPTRFTPEWPPKPNQKPLPKVFAKCSEKFKKVSWPPKEDEEEKIVEPPTTIPMQDELQLNDERWKPCGTYKLAPGIYAEQPAPLNEDVWPPPEAIDTSERAIYDDSRKKRVIRDYTVHFEKNKGPEPGKSYKVPPGTLHVVSQRGILQFDNVDIGKGTLAEPGQEKEPRENPGAPRVVQNQTPKPFQPQQQQQQFQPNDEEEEEEEEEEDEEEEEEDEQDL